MPGIMEIEPEEAKPPLSDGVQWTRAFKEEAETEIREEIKRAVPNQQTELK